MFDALWPKQGQAPGAHAAEPGPGSASGGPEPVPATTAFIDEYLDESGDRRVPVSEDASDDSEYAAGLPRRWFSWRKLWRFTGPGFLMSIAYLDPGNLEGDLQAGAHTGYRLCWVLLCSTAAGFLLQMLAAKLGVATGLHLAQHCRRVYPRAPRLALWLMTEIAIIGSDIQEVIGSAIAIRLLSNGLVPLWAGVLVTAVNSFAVLMLERLGVRLLEAVFAGLIATMAASFGVMYCLAGVPTGEVLKGLAVPRLPRSDLTWATAIVGAIIMPHNIYLHSALVQSRKIQASVIGRKKEAAAYYNIESAAALVISLFINIAVVSVFGKGFYGRSGDIGLENAGHFLGETFGPHMRLIWAVGLLAAGSSSTMTGTYTGQFVMNGFLNLRMPLLIRVLVTRGIAIVPTLAVALLYRRSQGNELDALNEWLNVLNSVQLPFALVPVLTMTASASIMGPHFANAPLTSAAAWAVALLLLLINLSAIWDFAHKAAPFSLPAGAALLLLLAAYLALIGYLALGPARIQRLHRRWGGKRPRSAEQPLLPEGEQRGPLLPESREPRS